MNKESRHKYILQIINKNGSIDLREIVNKCKVSTITARRDLEELSQKGFLLRTHGAAIKDESITNLFSFARRLDSKADKKTAISKFASQFVNDNDTILIDCGTTVFRLCDFISKRKNLRVITNSLPVASELAKYPDIKVTIIGGDVIPERRATYGPTACKNIHQYHATKAFIGTNGISLKDGLSSYDDFEAQITLAMAEVSDTVYLLCDSSKIEHNSVFKFAPISIVDYIITDTGVIEQVVKNYKKNNINILLA